MPERRRPLRRGEIIGEVVGPKPATEVEHFIQRPGVRRLVRHPRPCPCARARGAASASGAGREAIARRRELHSTPISTRAASGLRPMNDATRPR